jgi:hypothetical protein
MYLPEAPKPLSRPCDRKELLCFPYIEAAVECEPVVSWKVGWRRDGPVEKQWRHRIITYYCSRYHDIILDQLKAHGKPSRGAHTKSR